MNPEIRLVKSRDEFEKLETVWNALLPQSPANNYFLTWEWLWNWWQVYGRPDDELSILVAESDGKITGIVPLYVRRLHVVGKWYARRMMFLGTQENATGEVCSDYMNVICRQGEERELISLLFRTIIERAVCDEIYFSKIDTSTTTFDIIRKEADACGFLTIMTEESNSPFVKLPSNWDVYLYNLSPSMRYKIRNERRKIEKVGDVALSTAANDAELEKAFGELVRLHNNRWELKGERGAFSNEQFFRFHKKMMPVMLKNGHLELVLLSEHGVGKAAFYLIIYKNKIYFYQSGTDTSEKNIAFGTALHSYCIEEAINKGLSEYDFLPKGKADAYKDHFAKNYRTVADLYIVCSRRLKLFVKVREFARDIYHQVKPQHEPVGAMKAS